jgi:hypothetical protein
MRQKDPEKKSTREVVVPPIIMQDILFDKFKLVHD